MITALRKAIVAIALTLTACAADLSATEIPHVVPESEFVSLFDGKTLNGWQYTDGRKGYFATNGLLVCTRSGGFLFSEKEFSDFVLRLEFKLKPGGNNGIAIRTPLVKRATTFAVNEIQILDDTAKQYDKLEPAQYCGSLYKVFPAKRGSLKPVGEWNEMEITAYGPRIRVVLNGTTVTDGDIGTLHDAELLKNHAGLQNTTGHIGFLGHREYVEFRNIRIHEFVAHVLPK